MTDPSNPYAPVYSYGEKQAASALRKRIQTVISDTDPDAFNMMLGDRRIGKVELYPGTDQIARSAIMAPEFRGMGLGKKLYGDVLEAKGALQSDKGVSEAAARVWEGMPARGLEMQKNPDALEELVQGRVTGHYTSDHSPVFAATHPLHKESALNRKERDIELWEAYKANPSSFTLKPLMKQLDPVIQVEVNKWSGAIARPVLEAKAKTLALEAIKSYNPNGGAALATHVTNRLKKLSRKVYTHQDAVRLPEYKKLKVQSLFKANQQLMDIHGREATNQELADHLAWSPKTLSNVQQSQHAELIQSEDMGAGMFAQQSVWGSDTDDGMVDMLYFDMEPTDKLIFEHSTGYSGKPILSNTELRRKTGLTQGQLSYRKRQMVDMIKDHSI